MNQESPPPPKVVVVFEDQCEELIQQAYELEKLSACLIKNYDTGEDENLFHMLCEFYMCHRGLVDFLIKIKKEKEILYNRSHKKNYYMLLEEEGESLQLLINAKYVLEDDLRCYNITFGVH